MPSSTSHSTPVSDSFGRTEWIVLVALLTLNFTFGAGLSLQGPLYPSEAEKKGVTASVYGTVLGFYSFILFIFTPIVGAFLFTGKLSARRCFLYTYLILGTSLILYGLLDLIYSTVLFTITSFAVRGIDGFGSSGTSSQFIIMNLVFPKRIGLVVSLFEFTYLLGMSTGPLLGEVIFEHWGYMPTFIIFGFMELSLLFLISCWLPEIPEITRADLPLKDILEGLIKILRIPAVSLFLFTTIVTAIGTGFLIPILEPDFRQFHLTPVETGQMFLLVGAPQVLCPCWGFIADTEIRGEYITLFGGIIATFGIMLVGPVSFIPINPTIVLTAVGLVLFGLGQGALIASNFYNLLQGRRRAEVDDESLSSVVWVSVYYVCGCSLGGSIGPTVAGVLLDYAGFRVTTTCLWACYAFMSILILMFTLFNKSGQVEIRDVTNGGNFLSAPHVSDSETLPLLKVNSPH